MATPSWLAPNAGLAEPRVKKFAERIAKYVGAEIKEFWATEPTLHTVEDYEGNIWDEAWFCLRLEGDHTPFPIYIVDNWRKTISCFHAEYSGISECTEILLSGRVLY